MKMRTGVYFRKSSIRATRMKESLILRLTSNGSGSKTQTITLCSLHRTRIFTKQGSKFSIAMEDDPTGSCWLTTASILVTTSTTVSSSEFGLISTKKTSKRAKKIVKEIRRITVCQNGSH